MDVVDVSLGVFWGEEEGGSGGGGSGGGGGGGPILSKEIVEVNQDTGPSCVCVDVPVCDCGTIEDKWFW